MYDIKKKNIKQKALIVLLGSLTHAYDFKLLILSYWACVKNYLIITTKYNCRVRNQML